VDATGVRPDRDAIRAAVTPVPRADHEWRGRGRAHNRAPSMAAAAPDLAGSAIALPTSSEVARIAPGLVALSPRPLPLDRLLEPYLGSRPGYFVEAGACDGYFQSNTYSLERIHGWQGVLVEPVPFLAEAAARDRSAHVFNYALVGRDFPSETVSPRYAGGMTIVAGSLRNPTAERAWRDTVSRSVLEEPAHDFVVPARTLTSILEEVRAPRIDFLSLDVEGYEAQVLDGLDLQRFGPTYALVEVADDPARRSDVERALGDDYEAVARLTPLDVLYRRRDDGAPPPSAS
jgi:FkbM family methyltransferase